MNTRIWSIVAAAALISLSSGCSGMRTFWFGRGARCGACNPSASTAPAYGPSQPVATTPYAPTPYAPAVTVAPYQPPRCRLFGRRPKPQQPVVVAPATPCPCVCQDPCANVHVGTVCPGVGGTSSCGCGTCDSYTSGCGECAVASPCGGCGSGCGVDPYGAISDPYLSQGTVIDGSVMPYQGQIIDGQIMDGQFMDGQIIDGQIVGESGGTVIGSSVLPGTSGLPDNFDSRGDRIIRSDPLPPGAVLNP